MLDSAQAEKLRPYTPDYQDPLNLVLTFIDETANNLEAFHVAASMFSDEKSAQNFGLFQQEVALGLNAAVSALRQVIKPGEVLCYDGGIVRSFSLASPCIIIQTAPLTRDQPPIHELHKYKGLGGFSLQKR